MRKWGMFCVLLLLSALLGGCLGGNDFEKKARLTGTIYDENQQPFSGRAVVTLNGKSGSVAGSAYSFADLSPGSWELRVEAEGYDVFSKRLQLAAGGNTQNVVLVRSPVNEPDENGGEEGPGQNEATLAGKVYIGDTQNLVTTPVTVVLAGTLARTNLVQNGKYEFKRVPVGTATLTATAPGYEQYQVVVEVRTGGTTYDLRLQPTEETDPEDTVPHEDVPLRPLNFTMKALPRGIRFPVPQGSLDGISQRLDYDLEMAEYQVTYGLWQQVFEWATNAARGQQRYHFQNPGVMGNDAGADKCEQHPVTDINWRDAVIWCNALTEYYNALNGTALSCVYLTNGKIIRDSRDREARTFEDLLAHAPESDGFRLPHSDEWDLAVRYIGSTRPENSRVREMDGHFFTEENYPSGVNLFHWSFRDTAEVAWYAENSGGSTQPVGLKRPNKLGIYDMNGNVWEWCWDYMGGSAGYWRIVRGGSFDFPRADVMLYDNYLADYKSESIGLRLVRRTGN